MKHIHIVDPYHSVAMQKMTLPLQELSKLYEVTTGDAIDPAADLNFHMPWHTMTGYQREGNSKHVIAYTHCNKGAEAALVDACERADLVTCMSFRGRRELVELGVDPAKLWVIYAGANDFQFRRRVIGIVGYPQPNGRKREGLILDLAWQYDMSPFEFLFVGRDWEGVVDTLRSMGIPANTAHADDLGQMQTAYKLMDVLLVTGYVEGGPLPLLEAMAAGTPVLSPAFGYAADLLGEGNLYTDTDDLMDKLTRMTEKAILNHQLARAWTWRDYAAEYALIIGRLLGESVDLYPERGMSRYAQLLDVIDEIKPQSIVEIGTWNGNRAIQMIQAAAKYKPIGDIYYQGFDLFEGQTAEDLRNELSKVGWNEEAVQRRIDATGAGVMLHEGYTRDTLYRMELADLYFIDGGHSEETIAHDAESVFLRLQGDAVAIFDDYYHEGKPAGMGCNKLIDELDREQYEVTFLPALTDTSDGRKVGMVRVERRKENHADIRLQRRETSTGNHTDDSTSRVFTYAQVPTVWIGDAPGPSVSIS